MAERRNCRQFKSSIILVVIFIISIFTHTYAAQSTLDEHASELLKGALWVIGICFSLLNALIGYIFISNVKDIKEAHRVSMAEIKEAHRVGMGEVKEAHRVGASEVKEAHRVSMDEIKGRIETIFEKIDHIDEKKLDKEVHKELCAKGG